MPGYRMLVITGQGTGSQQVLLGSTAHIDDEEGVKSIDNHDDDGMQACHRYLYTKRKNKGGMQ